MELINLNTQDLYLKQYASRERLLAEYRKYGNLIVAVDFDDTLYNYHQQDGATYNQVVELVNELKGIGCEIIIWTGNKDLGFIKQFLYDNNIMYDKINEDSHIAKKWYKNKGIQAPRKIYANVYLDDRAGLLQTYNDLKYVVETINNKKASL